MLLRSLLVVGHPGHELRMHGWLEQVRPVVLVLTDGSGARGVSRTSSTADVVRAAGCTRGSIFGRFRDAEVYDWIIRGKIAPLIEVAQEIAEVIADLEVDYVAGDSCEFYNPVHDLTRLLLNVAVRLAGTDRPNYDYAVVGDPKTGTDADLVFSLSDAALARKTAAAAHFDGLQDDVNDAIVRHGVEAFRTERLHPVDAEVLQAEPLSTPFYELRGRKQVLAGRYSTVLTWNDHYGPLANALSMWSLGSSSALSGHGG
jgi:AcrR family transcriptional regulator